MTESRIEFGSRDDRKLLEEGTTLSPKFDSQGLIPAVATDCKTGDVLMLAYMNAEALRKTIELGEAVYYSRSRQELWHKGATSGHVQKVQSLRTDCDQDAIWMTVEQIGAAACHVGYRSCFYREIPLGIDAHSESYGLEFTESEKAYDPEKVYGKK